MLTSLVDVHRHAIPPELLREALNSGALSAPSQMRASIENWTLAGSLADMKKHGIAEAYFSVPSLALTPEIQRKMGADHRQVARLANEWLSEQAKTHNGSFRFFANVPMPDVDGTLDEIGYCLDVLKADGIKFVTSYEGVPLASPEFVPILEELDRRRTVVFVHPTVAPHSAALIPSMHPIFIEGPFDTTRAIINLIASGYISLYPHIKFIFCHGGGTTPYLISRIEMAREWFPAVAEKTPHGVREALGRLWFDVVTASDSENLKLLENLVGESQLLFGSDHPFVPTEHTLGRLRQAEFDRDLRNIGSGNARRVMNDR